MADNFIHSDLHPGNVLITLEETGEVDEQGQEVKQPVVTFLDCGIVQEVGWEDHRDMTNIALAFLNRDGYKAGALMLDQVGLSVASSCGQHVTSARPAQAKLNLCQDAEAFCQGIENMVQKALQQEW